MDVYHALLLSVVSAQVAREKRHTRSSVALIMTMDGCEGRACAQRVATARSEVKDFQPERTVVAPGPAVWA
jgi:hypothetical protein